jgi:hypothetical protein
MALTLTPVSGGNYAEANKRVRVFDITFDSSYVTGGEPLTPANVGLKKIEQAIPHGLARGGASDVEAVGVSYDYTNQKLFAYETAATVDLAFKEVTSTANLSTYDVRMTFIGY